VRDEAVAVTVKGTASHGGHGEDDIADGCWSVVTGSTVVHGWISHPTLDEGRHRRWRLNWQRQLPVIHGY